MINDILNAIKDSYLNSSYDIKVSDRGTLRQKIAEVQAEGREAGTAGLVGLALDNYATSRPATTH